MFSFVARTPGSRHPGFPKARPALTWRPRPVAGPPHRSGAKVKFCKIMNFLSLGNVFIIIQNKYLRGILVFKALCHGNVHR